MSAWRLAAACRDCDPEMWFAAADSPAAAEARSICAACPVQAPCLEAALAAEQACSRESRYGIYAGLSGGQRRRLMERRRAAQPVSEAAA